MTVSAGIVVGSQVWVEDPEVAWLDGEVVEVNGDEIKITTTSGKTAVANVANAYPKDPDAPPCGVDDMTKLAYLHEPGVLYNLRCRYDTNEIYTYTGNILIAVNPFQRLPHLYNNSVMEQYKGVAIGELSPHPFAIADAAYRQMVNEGISQAILVSGESGAGKTESTKMLMQYLAYMGGRVAVEGRSVEQQVLESNPVLEAFGNAKTLRNNNSSRFGKFVEIQFNNNGRISGAAIRTYLLERSRVCQVSDPERNYHCFYMLCAAPPEEIEKYKLGNPRTFHYLNQSNCYELDGVDELKEYHSTRRAMDVVGIGSDKQDAIFRVVAAILHLGNIEFAKVSESDASQPKDDQSKFHLKTAADLLMCNEESLEDSLCKRVIVTRDETITRSLDPDAAATSRDALAKIVYSRLFDWLVTTLNHSIGQDANSKHLIGVLDIYGFESFKTNSFEQFCINLTNEKLQQHFNQHVFKLEQDEYKKEEIDWSYIEFVDNQDILDLIEKKPGGIIALLDEACMFPRSTHETFATKLYQTFKDHKRFVKPKLSQTDFTICHYAGDVTYQTELFLDKNKDYVVAEHQALLSASNCSFVSGLFPPLPEESSKSSKFSSIGSQFKQQLQALLETLSATEPHYVRCVKPNNLLKPAIFENSNVLQQLRCGGVMEAIRISCAGFPTRKTFDEFKIRFKILEPSVVNGSGDAIAACRKILAKVDLKGYQIGKTKVFLRAGQMAELDSHRILVLGKSACIIQKNVRKYFARRSFVSLRLSAIQIQAFCRGQSARDIYENKRRNAAALKTQKGTRTFLARKAYTRMYSTAVLVQAGLRGMAARDELKFRRKTKAAIIIQSRFRGHVACCWYLSLKRATIAAQCACRAMKAREELRMLKLAARETGALQEAKVRLEEEVKELTSQLEMEKRMRADIEEAKNQESAKLQSALEKIELELQESAKLKSELEKMHAELQEESAKLKSELETMQLELQESTKLKSDIEKMQAELQESAKLKTDMEKMQAELQESAGLKSDMEKMQAELQKSASLKSDMEKMQAELQESAGLKSDMEKMQAELQKSASLKFDMEKMQAELQKSASLKYDMETMQVELQESAKLKSDMETMQAELQESAKLKSELEKMRAELQESSELQSELEKMRAELQESAELKSELEKMRVELQETKEQLMNERVAANKVSVHVPEPGAEDAPSAQEFQETKEQPMNGIEAENKEVPDTQEFQETKEQPMNELEAANKVTVDAPGPGVQEVTVIDHGLVDKLAAENEKLKLLVSSLEKKIDETEKKYEETNKLSEDRLKQAMEAESKMILLKTQMQRVEEKLSDIETEDHILRQQALLNAPSRKMSGSGRFGLSSQPMENGDPEPQKTMKRFSSASATYDKTKSTNIERHRESVDTLVTCISKNLGFSEGKPVAAFTIYKCLVHWKSLEAERTNIFDRLIQIIGSAIEDESNMDHMAYWLSNTSTLLFLLQHTLKASSSSPKKPPQPTSFFGRMAQSFRGSSSSRKLGFEGLLRQIEAKYPALLFKQQLTAYVEKIYGIIRDNTKNELSPLLSSCIQTPTTPREDAPSSPGGSLKDSSPIGHWGSIVERLNGLLATLKNNFVPPFLVQNISQQVFSYVNSELFNSLLLRKECCTFSNGEYIKAGLDELETWCGQEHEVLGPSWEELKHVRQAVGFLVIDQKSQITYDDLTTNMCPTLSVHQLYRICTIYGDDDSNTPSVDPEVISSMKKLMTEDSDEADTDTNSYMLDDNSSIPFPVEDIGNSFRQEDFSNVKPAEELLENPAFEFLRGS